MRPAVRAAFLGFTEPLEGRVRTMYVDVLGLVTTGVGNLIDPKPAALALRWRFSDGGLAPAVQIDAEWSALKARASEMSHHGPSVQARLCGLTLSLSDADVDELVLGKLDSNARFLVRYFPEFEAFPADGQLGLMSMAWAVGPGFPVKFPTFAAAVRAGDWSAAAQNCTIREDGNPGIVPRNNANRICFANAAAVTAHGLPPEVLWYPSFPGLPGLA